MKKPVQVGDAASIPGTLQYGSWEAFQHPTGQAETLPVIIAQGTRGGPTIWLTTGIHGPEHTGPLVLYRLLTQELVEELHGTIVAIPALCPAGLRTNSRVPYHSGINPNRLWPDGRPPQEPDPEKHPPNTLEIAYQQIFATIQETADYLIDYHNYAADSLSFAIQDRVLYRNDINADDNRKDAENLAARLDEMLKAYGHTTVLEFQAEKYIKDDLHRSTSGATLLLGQIPAITVELGYGLMPDPAIIKASVVGTRNVLRWAGMLEGDFEPITGIQVVDAGYPVRRSNAVRTPQTGVVVHLVDKGDIFKEGAPLAELRDVWGRPIEDGLILAEYDGFVVGRTHGIYYYAGDTILNLAIRDDEPLVGPYPDGFFIGS